MSLLRIAASLVIVGLGIAPSIAADLSGYRYGVCMTAATGQIALLPEDEIETRVASYYEEAGDALASEAVVGSRSPAFLWARETRFQCGKALGYLGGGHIDDVSIGKCDCAHSRLQSFR